MSDDDSRSQGEIGPGVESPSIRRYAVPQQLDDGADDIPTITADMIHYGRIDLEAGMKVVPPVTLSIILTCVAVSARQVWIGGLDNEARVVVTGAMHRAELLRGEAWRLISGAFMHANAEHLIGNMVMLFILGMACENAFGPGLFLFLYVAACVTGSLAVTVSAAPTVGASGAILPAAILTDRGKLAEQTMTRVQTGVAIIALLASAAFFLPCLR